MVDLFYSSTSHEHQEQGDATEEDQEFCFSDNEESDNNGNQRCMIRWKSGKRVDPRLLTTLESFKEIYDEKRDLFKKIFPGMYDEFVDVFKKLGEMRNKNKEARTLERSLSLDSPRSCSCGMEMDDVDEFVNGRFKVKPPTITIGGQVGINH